MNSEFFLVDKNTCYQRKTGVIWTKVAKTRVYAMFF